MSEAPKYKTPKDAKTYVYISSIIIGKEIVNSDIVIAPSTAGLGRADDLIEMVDVHLPLWPIKGENA